MKTFSLLIKVLFAGAVTLAIDTLTVSADVLTADNPDSPTNDTTVTVGTDGITGYFFAATKPTAGGSTSDIQDLSESPYISSVAPTLTASTNGGPSYATITADGTSYYTGVYYSNQGSSTYQSVAKIQLATDPSVAIPTFTLGVLTGSASADTENDDLYQLTLYTSNNMAVNSTPLQLNKQPDDANPTTDDFFSATVSGATTGDYLELTAAKNPGNSGNNIVFGGVTFSAASTPEPSTYRFLFLGLGYLILVTRWRRSQS
jgi:hypothetical protein